MKKKIISMICVFAMMCSIVPLQALATTTDTNIAQHKDTLEKYYIPTELITDSYTDEDGNACFVLDYGNVVETVSLIPSIDGTYSIHIEGGGLTNDVYISPDGDTYLNGDKVIYEEIVYDAPISQSHVNTIMPRSNTITPRATYYQYSYDPPFGSSSEVDYTYYASHQDRNVRLTTLLCLITVTALVTVLTPFFAWASAASSVAYILHAMGEVDNIRSTGLSYTEIVSTLDDVPIVGVVYEYYTTWYPEPDFGGTPTTQVYYETVEYY